MKETNTDYDFIIVGSGIGGLISAVILAMEGNSVLVLEKNSQIGGSLQVFSRDKCVFDTGVHYIGSLDKGENLFQIFKYVGIMDDLNIKRLDSDCFDMIHFSDGSSYKHGQGYDGFKEGLYMSFPDERDAIDSFCSKIKEMCGYFPLYNLKEQDDGANYINTPEILSIGAWDYVSSITKNDRLQSVLLGSGLLYAGDRKTTPLYVVALIMNSYLSGSYRMLDGGSQIAKLLTKRLHKLGGKLLKHKDVTTSEYESGSVVSVKTKDGNTYNGKTFISNTHPLKTIEIFGQNNFRAAYRHRIEKLKNTISSFIVYVSFHENSFPYLNYNKYIYKSENVWDTTDYSRQNWPEVMFVSVNAVQKQGDFANGMSVMTYMDYKEVEKWADTFNIVGEESERGKDYEEFKQEKIEVVINELEKSFPDIRKSIKGVYAATPLTFKDYIGTKDGSLYGIEKDYNDSIRSRIDAKTKIPNLFQTGQNIVFHGILGSTIGALVCSFNFVNQNELIEKIKNA